MDLATFETLQTDNGQRAIALAAELQPTEEIFLGCLTRLQKQFPSPLAKAALETVILRAKAHTKFSRASQMYFTRGALEMATAESISRYRAKRFAPFASVADLGCGIGGDSIALAGGGELTAIDRDPLHLAIAAANLSVYHLSAQFLSADLENTPPPPAAAIFFDPGRRAEGKRIFSVRHYRPPLSLLHAWRQGTPNIAAKISPGVNLDELAEFNGEVEFISLGGELKEAVLWLGEFHTAHFRATLLPGGHTLTAQSAPEQTEITSPRAILYEPDPAILRAGLVTTLAGLIGATRIDDTIAYLTSDKPVDTPFARAFQVEAVLPFSQKRLREALRARGVGRVTIKKRGSPLDPASFARSLKLRGSEERIVFLTRSLDKPVAIIATA